MKFQIDSTIPLGQQIARKHFLAKLARMRASAEKQHYILGNITATKQECERAEQWLRDHGWQEFQIAAIKRGTAW